jgi:FkbM family methyltransferase
MSVRTRLVTALHRAADVLAAGAHPDPPAPGHAARAAVPGPAPDPPPQHLAATRSLRQPLAGTYAGDGRVLVYLETGGRLYLDASDRTLVPELLRDGIYDVPFTRFLHRTIKPTDTVVDVGANAGLFTVIAGHLAWQGRTIAFEPAPALHALLRDNVVANWLGDRVETRRLAVGAAAATATLQYAPTLQMLGGLTVDPARFSAAYPGAPLEAVEVAVVALDEELADAGPLALVKIDVEGGEADVLAGMRRLIEAGRVGIVTAEVRRDTTLRNMGAEGFDRLAGELRWLDGLGARFADLDGAGGEVPLTLAEVLDRALFSNLVIRLV